MAEIGGSAFEEIVALGGVAHDGEVGVQIVALVDAHGGGVGKLEVFPGHPVEIFIHAIDPRREGEAEGEAGLAVFEV